MNYITRSDALARKAKRCGLAKTTPTMLEITEDHDESLFKRMRDLHTVYTIYYPQYGQHPQCGTVVERYSLTSELSLSCTQPAPDG